MKVAIPSPEGYIEVNHVDGYEPLLFRQKIEHGDVYITQKSGAQAPCMDSVGMTPESFGLDVGKSWIYRPIAKTQGVYVGDGNYAKVAKFEGWRPLEFGDTVTLGDHFKGKTLNTPCTGAIGHEIIHWMGPEPTFRENWIYRQQEKFMPPWAKAEPEKEGHWVLLSETAVIKPGDIAIKSEESMDLMFCKNHPNETSFLDGKLCKYLTCQEFGYGNGKYTVRRVMDQSNAELVYRWVEKEKKGIWRSVEPEEFVEEWDLVTRGVILTDLDDVASKHKQGNFLDKYGQYLSCYKPGYAGKTAEWVLRTSNGTAIYRRNPPILPKKAETFKGQDYSKDELAEMDRNFTLMLRRKGMNAAYSEPLPLP